LMTIQSIARKTEVFISANLLGCSIVTWVRRASHFSLIGFSTTSSLTR
jgi:branched-subunit amino acid transport protein